MTSHWLQLHCQSYIRTAGLDLYFFPCKLVGYILTKSKCLAFLFLVDIIHLYIFGMAIDVTWVIWENINGISPCNTFKHFVFLLYSLLKLPSILISFWYFLAQWQRGSQLYIRLHQVMHIERLMVVGQKLILINIISKFSMNSVSWLCQAGISLEDTNTNESSIEWDWLECFQP